MTDGVSTSPTGGNSSWAANPASGVWNTGDNWTPATIPTNTANFGASAQTGIGFAANSSSAVEAITFAAGAPSYTFTFEAPSPELPTLTILGAGVVNHSGKTQRFVIAASAISRQNAQLTFGNAASAGDASTAYAVGPSTPAAAGGGVLAFYENSTAGSAIFTITTGAGTPQEPGTVGGEVSFSNNSSAGTAQFTVYGSTSTTDGDTFGNAVFHDTATAANAVFTNIGGTVKGGDGGNTQFYDNSTAANGLFHNLGGTAAGANGGDVAFDGTATAADGRFHNYPSTAAEGNGGVTSFNNNPPLMPTNAVAASAGRGHFFNYGAQATGQGGGHTYFTAKDGSATAAEGHFFNYGSAVKTSASGAGHTVFSVTFPQKPQYCPDGGKGVFWNFPGTAEGAPGGYTEFTVYPPYDDKKSGGTNQTNNPPITDAKGPTAGQATCINLGATTKGAYGGETIFGVTANAVEAQLIALGGSGGGEGGRIKFEGESLGGTATVRLHGNGTLDISSHSQPGLTIGTLDLVGGVIETTVGTSTPCLAVSGQLSMGSGTTAFYFKAGDGLATGTAYTILTAPNLSSFHAGQFMGNPLNGAAPKFTIVGNALQVTFG